MTDPMTTPPPDPWAVKVDKFWLHGSQREWISKERFDAARAEVEHQHAEEVARLKAQIAALTAERDALRARRSQ